MTLTLHPQAIQRARYAVLAMFFINGALFANWVARIPQVQKTLDLSDGELGLVLLGVSVGVLLALSLVGGLVSRYGSKYVTTGGGLMMCLFLPFLAVMPTPALLWGNLFLMGMAMSTMDVAMNAQAVDVENHAQRALMSTFHASFSVGAFAGAAIGAGMTALQIEILPHFIIASVSFAILTVISQQFLLAHEPADDNIGDAPTFQFPAPVLWPIGVIAFAAAIGEGAMADWSGVYLSKVVLTDDSTAALGFAVFSILMTVGRLSGDYLTERFSSVLIVRYGGIIATLGLGLAILVPETPAVLLGFGMVGLGLSTVVPLAFSAAGRLPNIPASTGIAGVATIGYAGFLAGPPIIGLVAEATDLTWSMIFVAVLAASLIFTSQSLSKVEKRKVE
jgi:MFS family permease